MKLQPCGVPSILASPAARNLRFALFAILITTKIPNHLFDNDDRKAPSFSIKSSQLRIMAPKRDRENDAQEPNVKRVKGGFKVGPDNLPDGTWRRKGILPLPLQG